MDAGSYSWQHCRTPTASALVPTVALCPHTAPLTHTHTYTCALQGFTKFLKKNAKIPFELPKKEKKGKKEKKAEEDGE